jgi:hypothetical protein
MVNEKKDKAFKVFEKIAKSNGRCLDELEELKMLNLPHDHTKSQDLIQTHVCRIFKEINKDSFKS